MKITDQEKFWIGSQGDRYIKRNSVGLRSFSIGRDLLANKVDIKSALEIGPNIGLNLDALKRIYPGLDTFGVEINKKAYQLFKKKHKSVNKSILNYNSKKKFDLVLIIGVLIHQNPNKLQDIYKKIFNFSKKYIYLCEYFNPYPVEIPYRGERNRLYKRDFAKEMWKKYKSLKLINYGFYWKEDPFFRKPTDSANWFLFSK